MKLVSLTVSLINLVVEKALKCVSAGMKSVWQDLK